MQDNSLTLGQIFASVRRNRFKALVAWLTVMSIVIGLFLIWPRKYGSEGRLYIRMGRNQVTLSPATGSSSATVLDTRETEIRSVAEIVKSRAVIESVVDQVGAENILEGGWGSLLPEFSLPKFQADGQADMTDQRYRHLRLREQAAKQIEESMSVESEKKASVISVFVKSNSAELSQRIVKEIFEETKKVHLKIHESAKSAAFFEEQFLKHEKRLVKSVANLAEFRNRKQVLSVRAARATLQGILTTLENDVLHADVDLAQSSRRLEKLKELMQTTKAQIETPTVGVERLSYEDSRTEVFRLEAERDRLVSMYTATHPDVARVEAQLLRLKESLKSMVDERTEMTMASNPVYEAMQVDLLRAQADTAAVAARLEGLKEKRQLRMTELVDLNHADSEADQLQRDVEIARQDLGIYSQKRGEAKAMALLDDQKISDVVVAQAPILGLKHVSPRGSLVLPLGFLAGILAAFAVSLYADRNRLNPTLGARDIERAIDLPVLVTLPREQPQRMRVNG